MSGGMRSFVSYKKKSFKFLEAFFFEDKSLPYISYSLLLPFKGSAFGARPGLAAAALNLLDQGAGAYSAEAIQEKLNYYGTELDVRVGRESAAVSLSRPVGACASVMGAVLRHDFSTAF